MKHKYILQLFTALFMAVSGFAQPVIRAQKAIGGNVTDQFSCMARTKDGGLIVGGISNSGISGVTSQNPVNRFDYWVVDITKRLNN